MSTCFQLVRDPPTAHVDPYTHAPVAASAACTVASPSARCIGQAACGDRAGAFCPRPAAPKGAPALAKRGVGRPPGGPTSLLRDQPTVFACPLGQAGRWASDRDPDGTSPGRRAAAAGSAHLKPPSRGAPEGSVGQLASWTIGRGAATRPQSGGGPAGPQQRVCQPLPLLPLPPSQRAKTQVQRRNHKHVQRRRAQQAAQDHHGHGRLNLAARLPRRKSQRHQAQASGERRHQDRH